MRAGVHAERAHWRARHGQHPFFTLGTASYLDAREGRFTDYLAMAAESNPVVARRFGWLLERLRLAIETHVGGQAAFHPSLALPGFHIFLFHAAFRQTGAAVHYDLQYELIDWSPIGSPDVGAQLSMTLTIALPAAGGGLLVWNINRRALDGMTPAERVAHSRANRVARREPYTVGHVAVHSGHELHQIGPAPDLRPGDERITLQAHAVPVDGRWIIYW